jgi:hypothetical protein
MKLFMGSVISAALILSAAAANAQGAAPREAGRPGYGPATDASGPYAAMPPDVPMPGYGPALLPPREVYTVLRENRLLPLGAPRLRGFFYVIAVTDRRGGDGRLVIDARDGQIVRFVPAYRMGDNFGGNTPYGPYPPAGRLPSAGEWSDPPRPPESVPKMAGRSPAVPLPRAAPPRPGEDKPLAEKPHVPQQSAAVQTKPLDSATAPQASTPPVEARPVEPRPEPKPLTPQILPTGPMPQVQGLD